MNDLECDVRNVSEGLNRISAKHLAHLKATKGRFNLFTVLWPAHYEVQLHTRYLIHLLNPQDTVDSHHDCDELFLKLFVETLKRVPEHLENKQPNVPPLRDIVASLQNLERASVGSKNTSDFGNLDVLIECPGWGEIVIENKIRHGEEPDQLLRYGQYLQQRTSGHKGLLLYLTLDGKPSETASNTPYYRISYHDHVLPWLEECLRATYMHVNINQALQEYRNVVHELVFNTGPIEASYMNDIKTLVAQYPALIADFGKLSRGIDALRSEYQEKMLQNVAKSVAAEFGCQPQAIKRQPHLRTWSIPNVRLRKASDLRCIIEADVRANELYASFDGSLTDGCSGIHRRMSESNSNVCGDCNANASWPLGYRFLAPEGEFLNDAILAAVLLPSNKLCEEWTQSALEYIRLAVQHGGSR